MHDLASRTVTDVSGVPTSRELPVLLGAHTDNPETLLLIGTPDSTGVVHVRAWSADDWGAAPGVSAERASVILTWIEQQAAAGRSMNQSLYALRLWLRGEGSALR